jgi:hypothetical protein
MAIRRFIYQSVFAVPKPPVAGPSFGTAPVDTDVTVNASVPYQSQFRSPTVVVSAVISTAFAASAVILPAPNVTAALAQSSAGFVSPAAAPVTFQVGKSFGGFPSIHRRAVVIGGNLSYGLPAPVKQVIFTGGETFPDLVARPQQAPDTNRGFVAPPRSFFPTFGPQADLLPQSLRLTAPFVGFVSPAAAPVTFQVGGSFGGFPSIRRRSVVIGGNLSYGLAAPVTAQTIFFTGGETFPDLVSKPTQTPETNRGFVAPPRSFFPTFGPQADLIFPRRVLDPRAEFRPILIAYTPGSLAFCPQADLLRLPMPAQVSASFTSPTAAVSFTGGETFPDLVARPQQAPDTNRGFVAPPPAVTWSFEQTPEIFRRPLVLDAQQPFTSTFVIAATPSPLGFSQDPERFLLPIAASILNTGAPGFVFVPTAVTTPSAQGFSQYPETFARPRFPGLDTYSFVSTFTIAATPAALSFTQSPDLFAVRTTLLPPAGFVTPPTTPTFFPTFWQSPEQFTRSLRSFDQYTISFLQIAYTPSALAFLQSPDAFLPVRRPLELYSFVSASASAQPTISFTQAPEQFLKPRNPALDFYSFAFLQIAYTPSALTFSQSPDLFAYPRAPGLDRYDFSLLQIASTPAAFGFAQHPVAFTLPTLAQLLASGTPGFVFIPAAVPTPSAFGFSQWPEQFAQPRMPGLDQYSFTSTFVVAATPSNLTFMQSPDPVFPTLTAALQISGFIVPPDVIFPPLPPAGHGAHRKPKASVRPIWDRPKEKEARRPDAPQSAQIAPSPGQIAPQIAPRPDAGERIERQILPPASAPTPQPAAPTTKRAKRQIERLNLQEGPDYIVTVWYEVAEVVHGEIALLVSAQAHTVESNDAHLPAIAETSDQVTQASATVKIGIELIATSPDQMMGMGVHLGFSDDEEAMALLLDDEDEE